VASARDQDRLQLGGGAILSLDRAAQLLPISDQEARAWPRERGLVRVLLGRQVVIWGRVVEEIDRGGERAEVRTGAQRKPRRRRSDAI
jgi:hypothetical protein